MLTWVVFFDTSEKRLITRCPLRETWRTARFLRRASLEARECTSSSEDRRDMTGYRFVYVLYNWRKFRKFVAGVKMVPVGGCLTDIKLVQLTEWRISPKTKREDCDEATGFSVLDSVILVD